MLYLLTDIRMMVDMYNIIIGRYINHVRSATICDKSFVTMTCNSDRPRLQQLKKKYMRFSQF
jgi:hypothetical protein